MPRQSQISPHSFIHRNQTALREVGVVLINF